MIGIIIILLVALATFILSQYYKSPFRISVPYGSNSHGNREIMESKFFSVAESSIKMRHGELNRKFSSNHTVVRSLIQSIEKNENLRMKIISCPQLDIGGSLFYKFILAYPNQIELRFIKAREMPHFDIIDDKYFLLEDDHKPFKSPTGFMGKVDRKTIEKFNTFFNELWATALLSDFKNNIKKVTVLDDNQPADCLLNNDEAACTFGFVDRKDSDVEEKVDVEPYPASDEQLDELRKYALKEPAVLRQELKAELGLALTH